MCPQNYIFKEEKLMSDMNFTIEKAVLLQPNICIIDITKMDCEEGTLK